MLKSFAHSATLHLNLTTLLSNIFWLNESIIFRHCSDLALRCISQFFFFRHPYWIRSVRTYMHFLFVDLHNSIIFIAFQEAQSNRLCRRLQLKDIIPVEMQRLTKYPLLLENIAKYTGAVVFPYQSEVSQILIFSVRIYRLYSSKIWCVQQTSLNEAERARIHTNTYTLPHTLSLSHTPDLWVNQLLFQVYLSHFLFSTVLSHTPTQSFSCKCAFMI